MTVERFLVDTNVIIYQLGGRGDATKALQGKEIHISFVTVIELQSRSTLTVADLELVERS